MKGEQMMMTNEKMKINGCTPIEDLITEDFGAIGTPERDEFERGCEAFIIGERLKAERLKAGMTQEQLSTLFKIFQGLGRKISFTIW